MCETWETTIHNEGYEEGYGVALRKVGELLDDVTTVGASDEDWDEIIATLKRGEMPQ